MVRLLNKLFFGVLFLLLMVNVVSAVLDISIGVKPSFSEGEEIKFVYWIIPDSDESIEYYADLYCRDAVGLNPQIKQLNLSEGGEAVSGEYIYGTVDDTFLSQECTASVRITSPYDLVETTKFNIVGKSSFGFLIDIDGTTFLLNEEIPINYVSDITPDVSGVLTMPDSSTQQITLPTTIAANQLGTYTLEVIATAEGYRDVLETKEIVVIEKHTEIQDVSVCNVDGVCSEEETVQNCPQDCIREVEDEHIGIGGDKDAGLSMLVIVILSLVVLILVIAIIVILTIKNRRFKKKVFK